MFRSRETCERGQMSFRIPPPRLSAPLTKRPQVVAAVSAEEGDCCENRIRNRPLGDGWTLPILRRSEWLSFNLTKATTYRIHTSHQESPTSSPTSSTMNPKRSDNVALFPNHEFRTHENTFSIRYGPTVPLTSTSGGRLFRILPTHPATTPARCILLV